MAANCSVSGSNPRAVDVGGSAIALVVPFAVVCQPNVGSVRISTVTTGDELDADGYTISVSPNRGVAIGANGTATISDIRVGQVNIGLSNVAPNCEPVGVQSRLVSMAFGAKLDFEFAFQCVATGRFHIVTSTSGVDLDANGYALEVSRPAKGTRSVVQLATSGTFTATEFPPGDYTLSLSDVSSNCSPKPTVLSSSVTAGNATEVAFEVDCTAAKQIAYSTGMGTGSKIRIVKSNGTESFQLGSQTGANFDPDWSRDGNHLAFMSDRDGSRELYAMDSDGGHVARLTTIAGGNYRPAWSPDGKRIAFVSERDGNAEIYVMDADGGNPVRLTNNQSYDASPSWSSDGSRIAFQSDRDGVQSIWIMNSNGSNASRMASSINGDVQPSWSPDGTKIAFSRIVSTTSRDIFMADVDGSHLTQLSFKYS